MDTVRVMCYFDAYWDHLRSYQHCMVVIFADVDAVDHEDADDGANVHVDAGQ